MHCAATPRALAPPSAGGPPRPRRAGSNEPRRAAIRAVVDPHVRRGANTALTRRSRDVPCPCSWARWASGGGAAVRVGRLRPRGVVSAAAAACRGRPGAPTRASSLRRYPSLVVNGRSSSPARELAAATCPYRPYDPARSSPVPPHHPDTPHQRRPAAGGVKRGRTHVRQGFITHHRMVSVDSHDGQGLAHTTRASAAPHAA